MKALPSVGSTTRVDRPPASPSEFYSTPQDRRVGSRAFSCRFSSLVFVPSLPAGERVHRESRRTPAPSGLIRSETGVVR